MEIVHEDGGATFDLLVQYGARTDPSLLFDALVWRSDAAIKFRFLLSKGLDPTTTISAKWGTPLHVAAISANEEVIRILLDLGADPNSRSYCTKLKNNSPVEVAEWKMRAFHEGSSMKRTYHRVMELLESEKGGPCCLSIAVSERPNAENSTKPPETKRGIDVQRANDITGWLDSSNCGSDLLERPARGQSTRKRQASWDGTVSSRTRSRTKNVP